MNLRLVCKQLGILAALIGGMMVFSLPWAAPSLGYHGKQGVAASAGFEARGFRSLVISIAICLAVAAVLYLVGRKAKGRVFRKEAMAVVGLSWILATILGALPFYFCGIYRSPSVRLMGKEEKPLVYNYLAYNFRGIALHRWQSESIRDEEQHRLVDLLNQAGAKGLGERELAHRFYELPAGTDANAPQVAAVKDALNNLRKTEIWSDAIITPGEELDAPADRENNYRIRWIKMGIADCLFESQSGFSTTGATVISDLEDPVLIPHCILFWRSSTHFLGGLGIIVLFVVILGQGSAGKALMRAEMPGPTKEGATARMQHTAWMFTAMYCGLNLVLAVILLSKMNAFDAICHAFGTMATGGFSTYNKSVGAFDSAWIDYIITLFMILAGMNFTLLFFALIAKQPGKLVSDIEWRVYMSVILGVTVLVVTFGLFHDNFGNVADGIRYGLFQVVSIMTTTGYGTHDFDRWSSFGRGVLFLLMFVGGCAGSTGGGLKVIRHIMFLKIMRLEVERAYHPRVVRPLRIGGRPVEDPDLRKNILVYFGLILVLFVFSWLFVVTVEPDNTWGANPEHKLIDSASSIAATLNNIGPGLGTVGATQNYGQFSPLSKILFLWLMMLGRLEIFAILVLFAPGFWRRH